MKVLFATDGSPEDEQARRFVAEASWPAGTEIELFGVMTPVSPVVTGDLLDRDIRDLEHLLGDLATSLSRPDATVAWHCGIGRPADAIAARARAMEADLIVVGTRGRGALASTILGSVSAGVLDRAPCPVLVARSPHAKRIVLADDGSIGSGVAAALVEEWPVFAEGSLHVVAVVDVGRPLSSSSEAPMLYAAGERLYIEALDDERESARRTVAARAATLKPRPGPIKTSVRVGDAADEILRVAEDFAADLIVMGSRGHTGLARFFAGSVTRRVLHGAKCSVLVSRGSASLVRDRDRTTPLGVLASA